MISHNDVMRLRAKVEQAGDAFDELVTDIRAVTSDPDLEDRHWADITVLAMESARGAMSIRTIADSLGKLED